MVVNDKGDILQWGKFLKDKIIQKTEGKKAGSSDIKQMNRFPDSSKFDVLMESISTGPNHSACVSVKKSLYCWGNGEGGRLGLNKEEAAKCKNEPVAVSSLMSILY